MMAFFGERILSFLLSKVPCWNSKTEEEMVSPIVLCCHQIKDGSYSNNTTINKLLLRLQPIRSLES